MRVVAIEEHHIIPEMRSRMDLSLLPPAFRARLYATVGISGMLLPGIPVERIRSLGDAWSDGRLWDDIAWLAHPRLGEVHILQV
jgi:hypothetical protein